MLYAQLWGSIAFDTDVEMTFSISRAIISTFGYLYVKFEFASIQSCGNYWDFFFHQDPDQDPDERNYTNDYG